MFFKPRGAPYIYLDSKPKVSSPLALYVRTPSDEEDEVTSSPLPWSPTPSPSSQKSRFGDWSLGGVDKRRFDPALLASAALAERERSDRFNGVDDGSGPSGAEVDGVSGKVDGWLEDLRQQQVQGQSQSVPTDDMDVVIKSPIEQPERPVLSSFLDGVDQFNQANGDNGYASFRPLDAYTPTHLSREQSPSPPDPPPSANLNENTPARTEVEHLLPLPGTQLQDSPSQPDLRLDTHMTDAFPQRKHIQPVSPPSPTQSRKRSMPIQGGKERSGANRADENAEVDVPRRASPAQMAARKVASLRGRRVESGKSRVGMGLGRSDWF